MYLTYRFQLQHLLQGREAYACFNEACFTGRQSGSITRWCVATSGSKPGISEYVHANTFQLCFRNSRFVSFSLGNILPLMNMARESSSETRLISKTLSCVAWRPSSNVGGAWVCSTVSSFPQFGYPHRLILDTRTNSSGMRL